MIISCCAYPRAALIGNPSDGFFGKTIAFVFDNYQATVQIQASAELCFIPSSRDYSIFSGLEDMDQKISSFGYYGGIRLLKAAARTFYRFASERAIPVKENFTLRYESDIPNRLGLAGSSAIITAAMRAMFQFYGIKYSLPEMANLVLATERDELSIPAGLQDRVAQAYNVPVFMDFNREHMEHFGYGIYKELVMPEDLNLFVAFRTDLAEGSEILHSRLREDYNNGVPAVLDAMQEWAYLTDQVRKVIAEKDFEKLPALLNRNFDLRCQVCGKSVSPQNRKMVELARSAGASAKFTGSGGAIIGTYKDAEMLKNLTAVLKEHKINVLLPRIVTDPAMAYV